MNTELVEGFKMLDSSGSICFRHKNINLIYLLMNEN